MDGEYGWSYKNLFAVILLLILVVLILFRFDIAAIKHFFIDNLVQLFS